MVCEPPNNAQGDCGVGGSRENNFVKRNRNFEAGKMNRRQLMKGLGATAGAAFASPETAEILI
jgi:hypothetical protein